MTELKKRNGSLWEIATISLHCGLRFGEIANLKRGDIDTRRKIIGVRDSKGGFSRFGHMTEDAKRIFLNMRQGKREDLVFTNSDGNKINDVSKIYRATINKLGLSDGITDARQKLTFHSLRHTCASWLVDRGIALYDIKQLHSFLKEMIKGFNFTREAFASITVSNV